MAAETGSDGRCGIGARLRAGRERLGMTILQAAEKLHVDPKVLESLEAERFEDLGAPVFVRGHLRRYAELIGEQPAELLDLYAASIRVEAPDLTRLPKVAPSRDPRKLVLPALVILIGFALAGLVWWVLRGVDATIEPGIPLSPTVQAPAPAGSEQPVGREQAPEGGAAPAADVRETRAEVPAQAAPVREAPATDVSVAQAPPKTDAAAEQQAAAKPVEPPRPRTTELTLRFSEDSWVEVYDAKGERLFFDIGSANSMHTLTGSPPFQVVLGNAPAVALEVNGRTASLPADLVGEDDMARFVINRSGRIVRATPGGG